MAKYVHQTENQLIFDKVRSIKLECDLLYSYLSMMVAQNRKRLF